jgi:hypothetical protein
LRLRLLVVFLRTLEVGLMLIAVRVADRFVLHGHGFTVSRLATVLLGWVAFWALFDLVAGIRLGRQEGAAVSATEAALIEAGRRAR